MELFVKFFWFMEVNPVTHQYQCELNHTNTINLIMISIQISIHLKLLEPDKFTYINVNRTTRIDLISTMLSIQILIHLNLLEPDILTNIKVN